MPEVWAAGSLEWRSTFPERTRGQFAKAPSKQAFVATLSESSEDEECLMITDSEQGSPQAMWHSKQVAVPEFRHMMPDGHRHGFTFLRSMDLDGYSEGQAYFTPCRSCP